MIRFGAVSLFGLIVIKFAVANAPPENHNFNRALAVQMAMVRASTLLNDMKSAQAVEVLEEQLPNVNNNPQYLSLLRDGYRAYIRELYLGNQPQLAKRYLDRLCILDPNAARDPMLQPPAESPVSKAQPEPVKPAKQIFPDWKLVPNFFAKKEEPKSSAPVKPVAVRGTSASTITEDPFDRKNQRETSIDSAKVGQARDLVARGTAEFKLQRYAEARVCYEQAFAADRTALDTCKESWAYCILAGVAKTLDEPGAIPGKVPEMQKLVDDAISMAPTKMMKIGQELLQTIEQRSKQHSVAAPAAASNVKTRHLGANREGWQVTETANFRIFHRQDNEYAERVARIAETTRTKMYRKWFDVEAAQWTPICELIVHPTAASYSQMTGVPTNSPGHSRIESESNGRVTSRRLDLRMDTPGMMEAVLPHEATHVVLAGMFDAHHVPRWVDEGIAVLSEPDAKIDQHRRNLLKNHKEGQLFGLKELMELNDYPQPRRIGAFYAQSVVLVEFLMQKRGPKVFTDFVKDGLRQGYEPALQRHYSTTFAQLEQAWQQHIINNAERVASK